MRNFIVDPIADLIGDLKGNITTFLREEVALAKKEISEKTSIYARNGVKLVAGGFVAYAGLIVFLAAIGLIISFAFERLGLNSTLAAFVGLGIVGLLASTAGGLMVLLGIKAISKTPPAPEKTIHTLRQIRGRNGLQASKRRTEVTEPRSSDELHESAIETAERLQRYKEELAFRLSPMQLKKHAVRHIKEHPLMWTAVALGGAALATGTLLFGRKPLARAGIQAVNLLAHRL